MAIGQPFRRWATIGVVVGVVALDLVVLPELLGSRDTSMRLDAWIRTHTSQLPTTIAELQAVPGPFRAAVARALKPQTLSALWRGQLTELRSESSPSEPQRRHVDKMLSLVRPDVYEALAAGTVPPEAVQGRVLCGDVAGLFPSPQHRRMLKELGAGEQRIRVTPKNWQLMRLYFSDRIRNAFTVAASVGRCVCNTEASCNRCTWTTCACSADCEATHLFCGCSGFMPCDGWCSTS